MTKYQVTYFKQGLSQRKMVCLFPSYGGGWGELGMWFVSLWNSGLGILHWVFCVVSWNCVSPNNSVSCLLLSPSSLASFAFMSWSSAFRSLQVCLTFLFYSPSVERSCLECAFSSYFVQSFYLGTLWGLHWYWYQAFFLEKKSFNLASL